MRRCFVNRPFLNQYGVVCDMIEDVLIWEDKDKVDYFMNKRLENICGNEYSLVSRQKLLQKSQRINKTP